MLGTDYIILVEDDLQIGAMDEQQRFFRAELVDDNETVRVWSSLTMSTVESYPHTKKVIGQTAICPFEHLQKEKRP